jgi:hypothetical protein
MCFSAPPGAARAELAPFENGAWSGLGRCADVIRSENHYH